MKSKIDRELDALFVENSTQSFPKLKVKPDVLFLERSTWAIILGVSKELYKRHFWLKVIALIELGVIIWLLLK